MTPDDPADADHAEAEHADADHTADADGAAATAPAPGMPSPRSDPHGADDEATLGVDDVLGREVALVTLPPVSGPAHGTRVDRIRRLARLHHPHLIEVYDVDGLAGDSEQVLVLESVPGEPLDQLLDAGRMPAVRVAEIGARVASGLAHAHYHGVVHGRLGPASILVEDDRHVWLVGLTASMQEDAPPATPTPTPADDLRALATTLAAAVEPRGVPDLAPVLSDSLQGMGTAAALSDRLFRFARSGAGPAGTRTTPVVSPAATPVVLHPRPNPGPAPADTATTATAAAATTAATAATAATAETEPQPAGNRHRRGGAATAGAATAGAATAGAATAGAATVGSRAGGSPLGGSMRLATLAAAALLVALTSGLLIWGQETRGWFSASDAGLTAAPPAASPPGLAPLPLPVAVPGSGAGTPSRRFTTTDGSDADAGSATPSTRAPVTSPTTPVTVPPPTPAAGRTTPKLTPRAPAPAPTPPASSDPTTPPASSDPTTPPESSDPTTPPASSDPTTPPASSTAPSGGTSSSSASSSSAMTDSSSSDAGEEPAAQA